MNTGSIINDATRSFIVDTDWQDGKIVPIVGDASTRSYFRITKNNRRAILMVAPPGAEGAPCPPNATTAMRNQLGYNACARLAGPNLSAFVTIANALRDAGLSGPEIYKADPTTGLALIEDFGDGLLARILSASNQDKLYKRAIDVLIHLHATPIKIPPSDEYSIQEYDLHALQTEAGLLLEWYWPLKNGAEAPAELIDEYTTHFERLFHKLSAPSCLVLRDYHAENLLWLPNRKGVEQIGLIDFQDALIGHCAYDVASLLEDARRDVPSELARAMLQYYCERANATPSFDPARFVNDYAILAAQRNAKILGVFARLTKRDRKPRYLELLPRVEAYFRQDLQHPLLSDLHDFIAAHFPELNL